MNPSIVDLPPHGDPVPRRSPLEPLAPTVPPERPARRSSSSKEERLQTMHITDQFRDREVMVYDLRAGDRRVEIRISSQPDSQSLWHAALAVNGSSDATPLRAAGTSRRAALEALEGSPGDVLATRDWADIREALTAVRALR
jgi:hypothetical protein